MSDDATATDEWRDYKKLRQEKRQLNKADSTALLISEGIEFEAKNNGIHLIVRHAGRVVDYWPSTGKFIERGGSEGRGVLVLIKILKTTERGEG